MFGNIGPSELILIFFIVLILFGAKRLPDIAKSLGRSITEFKRAVNSTVSEIKDTIDEDNKKISSNDRLKLKSK